VFCTVWEDVFGVDTACLSAFFWHLFALFFLSVSSEGFGTLVNEDIIFVLFQQTLFVLAGLTIQVF
jgi:hypothetical protein